MMKALLFLFALALAGCGGARDGDGGGAASTPPRTQSSPASGTSARVSVVVTQAGEVFFNRRRVTLEELDAELKQLRGGQTGVCYHRELSQREPPPVARDVLRKIMEYELSVELNPEKCP